MLWPQEAFVGGLLGPLPKEFTGLYGAAGRGERRRRGGADVPPDKNAEAGP